MVAILLLIWLGFHFATEGAFLSARNLSNLMRQMSVTGLVAIGMVLVIVAGQIDLSVGSGVALVGGAAAILYVHHNFSPALTILAALGLGAAMGLIQGTLVAYLRIPAFIVTLGGMMAFRGALWSVTQSISIHLPEGFFRTFGVAYLPKPLGWALAGLAVAITISAFFLRRQSRLRYGLPAHGALFTAAQTALVSALILLFMAVMNSYQGVPLPVLILLVLTLLMSFVASGLSFGRGVYAIGGNPDAAYLSGIAVKRHLLGVFVILGLLVGVAGLTLTSWVGSATPEAGQLLELDAIAACVIGGASLMGGRGQVPGAILGALIMASLDNGMSLMNLDPFWQLVVKGCVLVAAVYIDILTRRRSG
jgi:D-xylose transport system permease protein